MNKTRQSIVNKLKYLKKYREILLERMYPGASTSYIQSYKAFNSNVMRQYGIVQPVISSNGMDIVCLDITYADKETLLNFLNELPDDCYLDVHQEQDYDDAYNYILRPYHYRSETDEEWNNRLSDLVRKVDSYLFHEKYKVKRSGIPELDKYIEYLEKQLLNKW